MEWLAVHVEQVPWTGPGAMAYTGTIIMLKYFVFMSAVFVMIIFINTKIGRKNHPALIVQDSDTVIKPKE